MRLGVKPRFTMLRSVSWRVPSTLISALRLRTCSGLIRVLITKRSSASRKRGPIEPRSAPERTVVMAADEKRSARFSTKPTSAWRETQNILASGAK